MKNEGRLMYKMGKKERKKRKERKKERKERKSIFQTNFPDIFY